MSEENEIDLDALQESIDEVVNEEPDEGTKELIEEIVEEESFNLDEALNNDEPVALVGRITDEEAKDEAVKRGWKESGKDKYGHSISAMEFLERAPFHRKIELIKKDREEDKKIIDQLVEQSKLIAKRAIDDKTKMLEDFKAEKETLLATELLDKDDIDKLKTLDKQIEDNAVGETNDKQDIENAVQEYESAKDTFVEENDWYQNNRDMTKLADKRGKEYAESYYKENNVLPPPEELFSYVKEEVKKDFPDMGKPRRATKVATRNNRTVTSNRQKKKTLDDLPEDQRAVARYVMDSADMTEDEYMKTYQTGAN